MSKSLVIYNLFIINEAHLHRLSHLPPIYFKGRKGKGNMPRDMYEQSALVYFPRLLQINCKFFSQSLPISIEQYRCWTQHQAQKCKNADAPTISRFFEQCRGAEWEDTTNYASEDSPGCDGRSGVFGERVDVVVLTGIENCDLTQSEKHG